MVGGICPPGVNILMTSEYRWQEEAMTSKRKTAANRRNAQLSTGPKDTSKSRYNAVTHGITSEQSVVPAVDGPDATERFNAILDGLRR